MSEFEAEVQKAKEELEQSSLVPVNLPGDEHAGTDEYLGDWRAQAQEYGQKFQEAANKAKDFATEKLGQAGERLKELQARDPKEYIEDAKDFARRKPGQTILISAAVGLALGLILRGRK